VPAPAPEPRRELTVADQRIHLQFRFDDERRDPTWAPAAERELSDDLRRVDVAGVRLASTACRASMCRAELRSESASAARTYIQDYVDHHKWRGPGFFATDQVTPEQGGTMVFFLGRTDMNLPYLD
jgi:hypothetical protein